MQPVDVVVQSSVIRVTARNFNPLQYQIRVYPENVQQQSVDFKDVLRVLGVKDDELAELFSYTYKDAKGQTQHVTNSIRVWDLMQWAVIAKRINKPLSIYHAQSGIDIFSPYHFATVYPDGRIEEQD